MLTIRIGTAIKTIGKITILVDEKPIEEIVGMSIPTKAEWDAMMRGKLKLQYISKPDPSVKFSERTFNPICKCGRGYSSWFDFKCKYCRTAQEQLAFNQRFKSKDNAP